MPRARTKGRSRPANSVAIAVGVVGALLPLVMVVLLAWRHLGPNAEPDTLDEWVAALASHDTKTLDRAQAELLRRGAEDPEAVIAALVGAMRAQAAKTPAAETPPVRLRLVAEDGDGLEVPPLPLGGWIFGERTLVGNAERLELTVVPVEAWAAFTATHRGRLLALTADGEILTLHRIDEADPKRLVLRPADASREAADGLRRVFSHHRFFNDGYTEAGRVLALLGSGVRPALAALAEEGEAEAHVAACAWWVLDRNEAEAATGR